MTAGLLNGRRRLAFAAIVIAVSAIVGAAFAYWASTDSTTPASASADALQAGNTPTLGGINGQDVTVSWTASTTSTAGAAATGYTVARYSTSTGGTATAATGSCSGTVTALTCTEQSVPAGTWYYAVTPKIGLWAGAESGRVSATVVASSFSVTSGQWIKAPGTVSGASIAHFKSAETVTFRLDSTGGTVLSASVSAVAGTGSASGFTVTIPSGTAEGAHTIVAVGGSGSQATSNSFTVDNTAPVTTDNSASIGSGWFNTTKTVTLTASDTGGSGVAATYYTTDGSTPTTASPSGTSVTLSTDGVYTVKYFSVDSAGNAEAVKTASTPIRIDKTNPTAATLTVPSAIRNGQALTDAATDATVNGASSGVSSVSYSYCAGTTCTPTLAIGTATTGPAYSVTWSSQPVDGTYRIQAVVTDAAGNTASSAVASTTVDNTAPSGGLVSYTNGYVTAASVTVTLANGTDGGSGVNTATTQLQRASATLSNGTCGSFGAFASVGSAGATSPYADTSVTSGNCYQYQYLVSDNAGNTATYSSASVVKVDATAPTFTVTSSGTNVKASGSTVYFKTSGAGSFTVTSSDADSGVASTTFPTTPTGWTVSGTGNTRTYTLGTASASTSLVVSAQNGAGTTGSVTVTITVDTTAPAITTTDLAIAPIDNTTTAGYVHQGGQYYVYANATDGGSGVATVTANVTNVTTGQTAVSLVAGSYTVGATTYGYRSAALTANATLTAGAKTYTATATDGVGNATPTANASVTVDNTNPTGSITAPTTAAGGPTATVSSNSLDFLGSGVASAVFQYSPHSAGTWTTIGTDTTNPYSVTWNTSGLTEGSTYDLRVITTDNASNTFTSAIVTVTIDFTAPAAPSTPALASASDSGVAGDNITNVTAPTFTGTAEAGSTVKVYDGSTQVASGTATGGNYSVTVSIFSPLSSGSHTVTATATDAAGNVSASSGSLTFTIDTTAATPVDVVLANGGTSRKVDAGDSVTITYSEQLNASSLCSAWTSNSSTQTLSNATVTVADGGTSDTLTATTASCTFNLGTVVIGNYVSGTSTSATFTSSTLAWDPTAKTLKITLGTLGTSNTTFLTSVVATAPKYTPVTAITDIAGNAMAATAFTDPSATGF